MTDNILKNDKTKTFILLIKIMDNSLNALVNENLSEEEEKKHLAKFQIVSYFFRELFREYLGTTNLRIAKKNELFFNELEVIRNLTPFQETLFANELKSIKNNNYLRKNHKFA